MTDRYRRGRRRFSREHERRADGKLKSSPDRPIQGRAASRDVQLRAVQTLFGQEGFESTAIRETGEQAGVDAALIARYFGSKAHLYIAAVVAEDAEGLPPNMRGWNTWPM